jgi:hypothetical protein
MTDLEPILKRFGNRGYRAAQLHAGIITSKLYLAAYAQGFGATGLTFFDDEVTDFFSSRQRQERDVPYCSGKESQEELGNQR